jgi:hypothetical protein
MKAQAVRGRLGSMIAAMALLTPAATRATQVALPASRDNTLYETITGEVSSGQGPAMFAGATAGLQVRRALLQFDVSTVPAGAHIDSVQLVLHMNRSSEVIPRDFTLHRVVAAWGEGASNAGGDGTGPGGGQGVPATTGDATWNFRFYDTDGWSTVGGDFDAAPLATTQVAGEDTYTWGSTPLLVADVQSWVDGNPNNGWMLRGPESIGLTARRFATRESSLAGDRPQLIVYFTSLTVEQRTWSGIKAVYGGAAR